MQKAFRYHFTQLFRVPAKKAYLWCTEYNPEDHKLMNENNAQRQIEFVSDGSILLTETFHTPSGTVEKQKLVQLYPERLMWVSTHLSGPNKHSQLIYEITAENDGASRLDFTALHLEQGEKLDAAGVKAFAAKLKKADSAIWKLLAKAMENEIGARA
jgi:hypothetical protein